MRLKVILKTMNTLYIPVVAADLERFGYRILALLVLDNVGCRLAYVVNFRMKNFTPFFSLPSLDSLHLYFLLL